jgi:hypothetical protein
LWCCWVYVFSFLVLECIIGRNGEGAEYDPEMFTPEDHAALSSAWSWVLDVVNPAVEAGRAGS